MKTLTRTLTTSSLALATVVGLGTSAHADDGVIELSQACAVQTGCLPGDSPGFPITIGSRGSYVMTSDLEVSDANTDAISITGHEVSLDMNGYAIRGVTTCSGIPAVCSSVGAGQGINSFAQSTSVRNGLVTGMGSAGIRVGVGADISNVRARSNGGIGISTGGNSRVTDSTALGNGDAGIKVNSGIVRDSVAQGNGEDGIRVLGWSSVIEANQSFGNGDNGIECNTACRIEGNTSYANRGNGIECAGTTGYGYGIHHNNAYGNTLDGIPLSGRRQHLQLQHGQRERGRWNRELQQQLDREHDGGQWRGGPQRGRHPDRRALAERLAAEHRTGSPGQLVEYRLQHAGNDPGLPLKRERAGSPEPARALLTIRKSKGMDS